MIKYENFIMQVNIDTIRFPFPNYNQVEEIKASKNFTAYIHLFFSKKNTCHNDYLDNQIIEQVYQNVTWFVIGFVWIVRIMLKLLYQ